LVYLWHLPTNGSKHLQAGYIKFSEWKGWDTCTYIYGFNPAQCVCLFNAKTWWFVCVRWIGVCCSFCLYCWNCLSYFLKWLFLKAVKHEINFFYQWSDCHFLADIQTPLVWTCTIYIPLMSPVHINYSSYKKKQQKNGKQILRTSHSFHSWKLKEDIYFPLEIHLARCLYDSKIKPPFKF
jgi:hypothetical protein